MTIKSSLACLLSVILSLGLVACSKVEYDFKTLGFTDKAEMDAAFAQGYHTKQKLTEMVKPAVVAAAPAPQVAASEPAPAASVPVTEPAPPASSPSATPEVSASAPAPIATASQLTAPQLTEPAKPKLPLVAVESSPFAPSFDCAKASNGAERLVCSDRELAGFDVELNQAYLRASESAQDKYKFNMAQRAWIKSKRNICSDKACMVAVYKQRITELSK